MSLQEIASRDLERLLREIERGAVRAPLTGAALKAAQLGHLAGKVDELSGLDGKAIRVVLGAVVAERAAARGAKATLVWTGPEGKSGWAEPTGHVVRELFEHAEQSVLVAGYSFDHGAAILEPLHAAMKRGVAVSLFLHLPRAPRNTRDVDAHARSELATFLARNWPFGPPRPELFYDPRTVQPGSLESLHAKCIVVDERVALIGSANFTDRGQTRNVEVGALIEDEAFARALVSQWHSAAVAGVFARAHE